MFKVYALPCTPTICHLLPPGVDRAVISRLKITHPAEAIAAPGGAPIFLTPLYRFKEIKLSYSILKRK